MSSGWTYPLFLLAAVPGFAQRTTSQIIGTASDPSGAALPGVTVTLRGPNVVGEQTSTTNVIVQSVAVTMSTFIEDPSGSHQPIATLVGSGASLVCRGGTCVPGTWRRPSPSDITTYVDASGTPVPLAPGQTWVELAPASVTGPGPIPIAQVTATAH